MAVTNATNVGSSFFSAALINGTNGTSSSNVVNLTAAELWIQLILFYGLMGVASMVCGVLTTAGIWRRKELRNRFFIIVACLTICRVLIVTQLLCLCFYRAFRTLAILRVDQLWITCHFFHFWLLNGLTLELTLLCTLVIDRMIALMRTSYFRLMSDKSALYVCLAQFIFVSLVKMIPSYVGHDPLGVLPCVNVYSFLSPAFNSYSQGVDIALVCIIMLLYFVLIFYVQYKVKLLKESAIENDAARIALQRQLKLMPILKNLVFIHCGFTTASKALLFASGQVPPEYSQRVTAAGGVATSLDLFVNVVWLLVTNKEVRQAAFPCLKKTNVVTVQLNSLQPAVISRIN